MTLPHIKTLLHHKQTKIQAQLLVLISICLLFSSCCSPGVRPEDANLFQAMCGLSTGEFEDQLENDQNQAVSSRQALEAEKSKSDALSTGLETSKAELEQLLSELDQMEQENRRIEAQISAMRTDTEEASQEQEQLQAKLETIQDQLEVLKQKASVEQNALEQYNAEKTRLKQEIEVLRMIISSQ
jgi:chromosome segregation ATPase